MNKLILLFLLCSTGAVAQKKTFTVSSPSGNIRLEVKHESPIAYSVYLNNKPLTTDSYLLLGINEEILGEFSILKKSYTRSVNTVIENPVPFKRKLIPDHYNELVLEFKNKFEIQFRAYDDRVAYRFKIAHKDSVIVTGEGAEFSFEKGSTVYWPEVQKREGLDMFHQVLKSRIKFFRWKK